MSLGIIAAMDREGSTLTGWPVRAGELVQFREGAFLFVSGVGPDRACLASRILIENGAAALLSWGFACGLRPDITPGEIVIPKWVISADDAIHVVDPLWRERLCSRIGVHLRICPGSLAESRNIMPDSSSKELLGRETGAVAADMESASICKAAWKAGIPFLAVRAVTDTMMMRVPRCAGGCVDGRGRIRPLRLVSGLMRRPAELPDVIRLCRNFQAAIKSLKSAASHGGNMFCLAENASPLRGHIPPE